MANEVRLIDANALQRLLFPIAVGLEKEYGSLGGAVAGVMHHVDAAPTIDPESLRPKGRWITDGNGVTYCGKCRHVDDYASVHNYCPNCGTDMRGEADDK